MEDVPISPPAADVEKALAAAASGRIRAICHQLMPLSAAGEAHLAAGNQITGKIILEPLRSNTSLCN